MIWKIPLDHKEWIKMKKIYHTISKPTWRSSFLKLEILFDWGRSSQFLHIFFFPNPRLIWDLLFIILAIPITSFQKNALIILIIFLYFCSWIFDIFNDILSQILRKLENFESPKIFYFISSFYHNFPPNNFIFQSSPKDQISHF